MSRRRGCLSRSVVIAAFAMIASGLSAPALAAEPRIVSMNVCTDQLLLPLADPAQILGLSRFSRDAWQSWAADDARRYPILSGGAEDVLVLKPDIVVASLFDKRSTRELLKAHGLHLAEFAVPRNLDEVKAQIREMGEIARASGSRGGGNRPARCGDGAGASSRDRQALSCAAAVPARLGLGRRQPGQFAADRDRAVQCGLRSRRRHRRLRLAGSDRER